ncbi:hypothetical protein HPB52_000254 [Rhipicephalus sanguineus]|uniref:Uncharacterized protein n=1 Tax=Rhipicephalus sanguineus TaxID=34632 RepID=A0A9D4STC9_RHISA|nr:hypothetical protein HPB52_000254 [Rhipicephalus sanguineus]
MESTPNSATGHHKSGKPSRRARKHRRSSASALSKSSTTDDDRQVAKPSPRLAAEASTFTSVPVPFSNQTSTISPAKPESGVPAESATTQTSPERPTVTVTPSVHLAFDNSLLVEEPVVVASPSSPLVIPEKPSASDRLSVTAETGGAAPHPRGSFATTTDADDGHHRIATSQQARQRTSDATFAGAGMQRKASCAKLVLSALPNALLVVLALAVVFAAVTVLTPDSSLPEVCRSHSCIEYSGRLRRTVNLVVSPCVSLTRFVCAGWTAHDEMGVRPGVVEAALDRLSRLAFAILGSPSHPQSTAQRAAMFFRSCEAVLRAAARNISGKEKIIPTMGERDELEDVKRALAEAGVTWPHRPPDKPDVLQALLFTAIKLGWPAVLRVEILGSDDAKQQSGDKEPTVLLTPSREFLMLARKHVSLLEAPASRNAYFALLRDSLASGTGEVVTFEATREVEDDFLLLATILSASPSRAEQLEASVLLSGKLAPESRWRSALSAYGLSLEKGRRLLVQTEHVDFVQAFIDAWEGSGEADTHLFVSWFTVQLAALFARRSLIVSFYGSHRGAQVMHRAFCLARAYLLYGGAAFAGYSADTLFASLRRNAEALAVTVRQKLRTSVSQWPHRNESMSIAVDWNSTDVMFKVLRHSKNVRCH